jgi:hypothetical protein
MAVIMKNIINYEHIKQNMYEKNNLQFHLSTGPLFLFKHQSPQITKQKARAWCNHRKQIPRNEPSA